MTPRELFSRAAAELEQADVYCGHGTDNCFDEAVFLVLHALGEPYERIDEIKDCELEQSQTDAAQKLIRERIERRIPAAYLTGRTWFAGLEFAVNDDVLVPRSPFAELIIGGCQPWLGSRPVSKILDIGTGSGCIAIAMACAFPDANGTATDISPAALAVARANGHRHRLDDRVDWVQADLYPTPAKRYDVIVSNPPYVPADSYANLPQEYAHEPSQALLADDGGFELVDRILNQACAHLSDHGMLFVEVGEIWEAFDQRYARLNPVWLEFANGGEGVCMLEAQALQAHGNEAR